MLGQWEDPGRREDDSAGCWVSGKILGDERTIVQVVGSVGRSRKTRRADDGAVSDQGL